MHRLISTALRLLAVLTLLLIAFGVPSCTVCTDQEDDDSNSVYCDGNLIKEIEDDIDPDNIERPNTIVVDTTLGQLRVFRTEVTNFHYASFLEEVNADPDRSEDGQSNDCNDESGEVALCYEFSRTDSYIEEDYTVQAGFDNYPATYMSWYAARKFCEAIDWRLPNEEEWKAIARSDQENQTYPWDNDVTPSCNVVNAKVDDSGSDITACEGNAVSVEDSAYDDAETEDGVRHMAGNVWEWTSDVSGDNRIVKGGDWNSEDEELAIDYDDQAYNPDQTFSDAGFRCVND